MNLFSDIMIHLNYHTELALERCDRVKIKYISKGGYLLWIVPGAPYGPKFHINQLLFCAQIFLGHYLIYILL